MAGPDFTGLGPLKIDSAQISYFVNGNVGIGTTSPTNKLAIGGEAGIDWIDVSGAFNFFALDFNNEDSTGVAFSGLNTALAALTLASKNDMYFDIERGGAVVGTQRYIFRANGTAVTLMVIQDDGRVGIGTNNPQAKLHVAGDVLANNNVKVWDSGWFAISALQALTKNHDLGTIPKFVIVWCAESASPTRMSVAGPFHVDSSGSGERGAYIARVDGSSLQVRAGNYIGINEAGDGWLTSGYYKVVAWA